MKIHQKTIEKLRQLINEETQYRSGPDLIAFFKPFGFQDIYGPEFPSRWMYTEKKLNALNDTNELEDCVTTLFAPINFIGKTHLLDKLIADFNQYLMYDGYKIVRNNIEISIWALSPGEIKIDSIDTKSDFSDVPLNTQQDSVLQTQEDKEILKLKPEIYGMGIDLKALGHLLKKKFSIKKTKNENINKETLKSSDQKIEINGSLKQVIIGVLILVIGTVIAASITYFVFGIGKPQSSPATNVYQPPQLKLTYEQQESVQDEAKFYHTNFIIYVYQPPGNFDTGFNIVTNIPDAECSKPEWKGTTSMTSGAIGSTTAEYIVSCTSYRPILDTQNLFILK